MRSTPTRWIERWVGEGIGIGAGGVDGWGGWKAFGMDLGLNIN
jgi:hypothetical protein